MSGSQQPLFGYGTSAYRIANSLRFRSSASAYLNRTPASAGNQKTWTWSGWVKRGALGGTQTLFYGGPDGSFWTVIGFDTSNKISVVSVDPATELELTTAAVYRDPSAWYHIVVVIDTTQATASNRQAVYVNGILQSLNITVQVPQNTNLSINSAAIHVFGRLNYATTNYLDGYLAEVNFIDGQALTPSSFGETNVTTGVWQPKQYSGTYGTNGFHLNFSNGTSTTTLGYDSSGNGNNWTTNNISLTAGSTYDWMLDSPNPYQGSSYGVGNYAVLNPVQSAGNGYTLSNANLTWSWSGGPGSFWQRASISVTSGKWYWETVWTDIGAGPNAVVGIQTPAAASSSGTSGDIGTGYGYYCDGTKYTGTTNSVYGASWTTGDVIGVAFDSDAGTLTFYKNNVSQGTAFTGISGAMAPVIMSFTGASRTTAGSINFGQRPFAYTPPSGYKSLCTYNLPTPTIQNGANYMAATLYTGNGATQSIVNAVNGISFAPDMVWVKNRSSSSNWHNICDIVRGVSTRLASNSTSAEAFFSGYATYAFNSNGFSVGDDASGQYDVNGSVGGTYSGNAQYVGWQWKAGGTAVTNTAGSITSSVSANTTSGFSVVTYTGTGANATVGHGLGVAPSMIICKSRTTVRAWPVYHTSIGNTNWLILNQTDASSVDSGMWNNTSPTSSVFSLGNSVYSNTNAANYVAYCFAAIPGYSAFGSYTGNGSSDGAFIYTGFLPRLILVKCSSTTGNWFILDTSRNTYNVIGEQLEPNLSNAGSTVTTLDVLSNGFKMRTSSDPNASQTYVYAAFAANPFTNSLAF